MKATDLLISISTTFFYFIPSYIGSLPFDAFPFRFGHLNAFKGRFIFFPYSLSSDPVYPSSSSNQDSKFVPDGFISFGTEFFP